MKTTEQLEQELFQLSARTLLCEVELNRMKVQEHELASQLAENEARKMGVMRGQRRLASVTWLEAYGNQLHDEPQVVVVGKFFYVGDVLTAEVIVEKRGAWTPIGEILDMGVIEGYFVATDKTDSGEFVPNRPQFDFAFSKVKEAAIASLEAKPIEGTRYVMGVDWASANDFGAIAVLDAETEKMVDYERFIGLEWAQQRNYIKSMFLRWNPTSIVAEENSMGLPNIEALQAEGLPMRSLRMTVKAKESIMEALAETLKWERLKIQPHGHLILEMSQYLIEKLPDGGTRYAPRAGLSDAGVMATALANWAILHGGVNSDFA